MGQFAPVKLCLVILLTGLLGGQVAAEEGFRINPFFDAARPIPGGQGFDYFFGTWRPRGQFNVDFFDDMTISPMGWLYFTYVRDHSDPRAVFQDYRVVHKGERGFLLLWRFWGIHQGKSEMDYRFVAVYSLSDDKYSENRIVFANCLDRKIDETVWRMTDQKILEIFRQSKFCNPRYTRATKKYPWQGWTNSHYSLIHRRPIEGGIGYK
jgi:hypothetical protein